MIKIGIADAHGIESYLDEEKVSKQKLFCLTMRAHVNRQRHTVIYKAEVDKKVDSLIQDKIAKKDFVGALEILKYKSAKIGIEEGREKSWEMIPNHDLDPWYTAVEKPKVDFKSL